MLKPEFVLNFRLRKVVKQRHQFRCQVIMHYETHVPLDEAFVAQQKVNVSLQSFGMKVIN